MKNDVTYVAAIPFNTLYAEADSSESESLSGSVSETVIEYSAAQEAKNLMGKKAFLLITPDSPNSILKNINTPMIIYVSGYGSAGIDYIDNGLQLDLENNKNIITITAQDLVDFLIIHGLQREQQVKLKLFTNQSAMQSIYGDLSFGQLVANELHKRGYVNCQTLGYTQNLLTYTDNEIEGSHKLIEAEESYKGCRAKDFKKLILPQIKKERISYFVVIPFVNDQINYGEEGVVSAQKNANDLVRNGKVGTLITPNKNLHALRQVGKDTCIIYVNGHSAAGSNCLSNGSGEVIDAIGIVDFLINKAGLQQEQYVTIKIFVCNSATNGKNDELSLSEMIATELDKRKFINCNVIGYQGYVSLNDHNIHKVIYDTKESSIGTRASKKRKTFGPKR